MKRIFLIVLLLAPFFASAQTVIKNLASKVTDTTAYTVPSGYGALRYKNQGGYTKWQYTNNGTTWLDFGSGGGGSISGSGTSNQLTYWTGSSALGALSTATYPSLLELSYVKGVTSSIQTQINDISNYSSTPPSIIYAQVIGQTMEGKTLSLSKVFKDVDGTAEGTSTYQWVRANDAAGTGAADISGATSSTYTLVTADNTKFISCKITPVNATPETGTLYQTAYVGAVDAIYYPADNANVIVSYGLTKLSSTYAGSCLQIQLISAGPTYDIGFDGNGVLDWSAIAGYGGMVYLKKWYDQSGNGFDMLFTAFADQPLIDQSGRFISWAAGNDAYVTHNSTMNIGTGDFSFFMEMAQLSLSDGLFTAFEKKTSYSANNLQLYSNNNAGFLMYTGNAGSNITTSIFSTPNYRNVIAGYRNSTTKYLQTNANITSAAETATDLTNTNNIKFNTGDGGDGVWRMWSFNLYKQNYGADYDKIKKYLSE